MRSTYTNANGIRTTIQAEDDAVHVHREQDITPMIDLNHYDRSSVEGFAKTKDMVHVARVDLVSYWKWYREWTETMGEDPQEFNTFLLGKIERESAETKTVNKRLI